MVVNESERRHFRNMVADRITRMAGNGYSFSDMAAEINAYGAQMGPKYTKDLRKDAAFMAYHHRLKEAARKREERGYQR